MDQPGDTVKHAAYYRLLGALAAVGATTIIGGAGVVAAYYPLRHSGFALQWLLIFALMVGGTLMGLLGALLALPVAAAIMMLIEELRVDLPGEQEQAADTEVRARDDLGEAEYERRTEGVGAEAAAAIAVEISVERKYEESHPVDPNEPDQTELGPGEPGQTV